MIEHQYVEATVAMLEDNYTGTKSQRIRFLRNYIEELEKENKGLWQFQHNVSKLVSHFTYGEDDSE